MNIAGRVYHAGLLWWTYVHVRVLLCRPPAYSLFDTASGGVTEMTSLHIEHELQAPN